MLRINTYNEIFLETRKALRDGGVSSFDLEARLIVEHASGKRREEFLRSARLFPPDGKFEKTVLSCLARRLKGEPIAYIVGQWEFYSLPVKVTADTLIPRIDTETLAERAITLLRSGATVMPHVLDLCCGTGCVGIAVVYNIGSARAVLADVDEAVVKLAKENAALNRLSKRIRVAQADALAPPPPLFGAFNMIVCNPPYIPSADIDALDVSVRAYEPRSALDGGADGLDFYRSVAKHWKSSLTEGGVLLFEVGVNQSKAVYDILRRNGYKEISVTRDYEGIERVVEGRV